MRGCGSDQAVWVERGRGRGEAGPVPIVFPPGISEAMTSQSQARVETWVGEQGEAWGSRGQEEDVEPGQEGLAGWQLLR